MSGNESTDGRHARRQRSREAIVDAAFSLVLEGKGPPSAEDVAKRAGVSVSSIFRNFEGLADIQQQAHRHFTVRYSHLLLAVPASCSNLESRIAFFIQTRLDLYEQAGPLMAMARVRAVEDDTWREHIALNRSALIRQLRSCFGPELHGLTPSASADLVAVLDTITSPEAFELLTRAHARTRKQISRVWTTTLHALITPARDWGLSPIAIGDTRGRQ